MLAALALPHLLSLPPLLLLLLLPAAARGLLDSPSTAVRAALTAARRRGRGGVLQRAINRPVRATTLPWRAPCLIAPCRTPHSPHPIKNHRDVRLVNTAACRIARCFMEHDEKEVSGGDRQKTRKNLARTA
eukprot:COSAG05_NODE_1240_length_5422_cov_6.791283_6_plen_131_part_00